MKTKPYLMFPSILAAVVCAVTVTTADVNTSDTQTCAEFQNPCSDHRSVWIRSPFSEMQAEQLWAALGAWKNGDDWIPLNTALHELLVVPPPDSFIRDYTIGELRKFTWMIDLSPFEDIFRECDAKTDYSCSQVFVENTLVFGDREWKSRLLRRALKKRGPNGTLWSGTLMVDGFRFKTSSVESVPWVFDLGLREIYPMVRVVGEIFATSGGQDSPYKWEQAHKANDQLLGTDEGSAHPVQVLTNRLGRVDPDVIIGYALDPDKSSSAVSRFQGKLRTWCRWWPNGDSAPERARLFTGNQLEPLMELLGGAYRAFWVDPPQEVLKNPQCVVSAGARLAHEFQGRICDSSFSVSEYAFDTPQETWEYMEAARQRSEPPHGEE